MSISYKLLILLSLRSLNTQINITLKGKKTPILGLIEFFIYFERIKVIN